jgi:glycerol-3-phosphate acyltransferase PlsY
MDIILLTIITVLGSYLLGSVPPAYIISKVFYGVDIRKEGSGNVGGANAGRLFGKKVLLIVGLFDILKGTAAVLLTDYMITDSLDTVGFFSHSANIVAIAGFAAIFGHCYSLFLKFSGGKGGATTAGVVLALDPFTFLILIIFWIIIVGTTRFTSLGNLLGILIIPLLLQYRTGDEANFMLGLALIVLIYWRHRANVGRLLRGEERKFGNREKIIMSNPDETAAE